jgi:hypothetical protein
MTKGNLAMTGKRLAMTGERLARIFPGCHMPEASKGPNHTIR